MYLFRIFYSFLPLRNPLGFGASDLIILAIAVLFVLLIVAQAWLSPFAHKLAAHSKACMGFLFGSVILLRLSLFPVSRAPIPSGADDFAYLLLGDTLAHFRLANPAHPLSQFFESVFILQQPTYSSIYPLGQGLVLATGEILGNPWTGVLLSAGVFSALCYWMLRGWTSSIWALAGGILAVIEFGPLSSWMNSYWGGYVSAIAGCLVFGSLPRLNKSVRVRDAVFLGIGLALQLLTRPFEALFLFLASAGYLAFHRWNRLERPLKPLLAVATPILLALVIILAQNRAVTQNWGTLPYMLSRYQYGVPASLTFQPNPIPHRLMTKEQDLDYQAQSSVHGARTDSLRAYAGRLGYRFRYLRFFLLPPLLVAVLALLRNFRKPSYGWSFGTVILFFLGTNFYPYFYPHYLAALTCLFVLFCVQGLRMLSASTRWVLWMPSLAFFIFWFGICASGNNDLLPLLQYQDWYYLNSGDPQGRSAVETELSNAPGQQLVFVRYSPFHRFEEWIHNDADIDQARIVWANDLGEEENVKLQHYYSNRKVWIVEPDRRPPLLTPYPPVSGTFQSVH